jgi:hypothetical protein
LRTDPFLPDLDPTSAEAAELAATARELVTAYLAHSHDPVMLRIVLRTTLAELYQGLAPTLAQTRRAAGLLCSLAALLQVALSGVGQLVADGDGAEEGEIDPIDVAAVFEQLAASAIDDDLTF